MWQLLISAKFWCQLLVTQIYWICLPKTIQRKFEIFIWRLFRFWKVLDSIFQLCQRVQVPSGILKHNGMLLNPIFLYFSDNTLLQSQVTFKRTVESIKANILPKLIYKTRQLSAHGIQFLQKNDKNYNFTMNELAVFRYRNPCLENFCFHNVVKDESATKYSSKLYENVDAVCKRFYSNGKCPNKNWSDFVELIFIILFWDLLKAWKWY